eukprot:TRINITY_DN7853_c0_g1_i1.p1 TRINITY_DN7853_c0_g1~~TRINITY_DN7853_c0_g1_i1.p1  ORF type:complete len:289 (-),score=81.85 TRINITY_DN7853_c0_g1_i1:249-1115(-)
MVIIDEEPLQKYDGTGFEFQKMKAEVAGGVKEDWKRDKIDDAKKRAITDCKSYDEFKSRVAGCTLKPIHKSEFNAPPKMTFGNRTAESKSSTPHTLAGYNAVNEPSAPSAVSSAVLQKTRTMGSDSTVLKNPRDLDKELRKLKTPEEKARLVAERLSTEADVQRIFGRELDAEVFRKLLEALVDAGSGAVPPGTGRQFLRSVAERCPSALSAAASFFTNEERRLVATILARDKADAGEDSRICATLGVTSAMLKEACAELGADSTPVGVASGETASSGAIVQSCDSMD